MVFVTTFIILYEKYEKYKLRNYLQSKTHIKLDEFYLVIFSKK